MPSLTDGHMYVRTFQFAGLLLLRLYMLELPNANT